MALQQKISGMTPLGEAPAIGDYIPIVDVSASPIETKRVTVANLMSLAEDAGAVATHESTYDHGDIEHSNRDELDLISDGDHDVRTDNPHGVTTTQIGAVAESAFDAAESVLFAATAGAPVAAHVRKLQAYNPGHFARTALPYLDGNNYTLVLTAPFNVNINDIGYTQETDVTLDLSAPASWDDTAATDWTVAANRAGRDFCLYACDNSGALALLLSANSTYPTGYTADNSRKIGGFHCLCAAVNHETTLTAWAASTAVSCGETRRATSWDGRLYRCTTAGTTGTTEPDWSGHAVGETVTDGDAVWIVEQHALEGYAAGDILPASIWDLLHRPRSAPDGMVYNDQKGVWIDIYPQSGTGSNTSSIYGGTIVRSRTWYHLNDDLSIVGKRLLKSSEFITAAAGSNEETNIAGSSNPVTAGGHVDDYGRRLVSNCGCEDCCGVVWHFLDTPHFRDTETTAFGWEDPSGDSKGSMYCQGLTSYTQILAGGNWTYGIYCGSHSKYMGVRGGYEGSSFSGRGCCNPI